MVSWYLILIFSFKLLRYWSEKYQNYISSFLELTSNFLRTWIVFRKFARSNRNLGYYNNWNMFLTLRAQGTVDKAAQEVVISILEYHFSLYVVLNINRFIQIFQESFDSQLLFYRKRHQILLPCCSQLLSLILN